MLETTPSRGRHLDNTWEPHAIGLRVRLRDNPGRQGTTTGRTRAAGTFLLVEIDFGPNEKQFKRYDLLETIETEEEMFDLLGTGRFGSPTDLRRILTFEKVKGDLTNVFYSMETSNTDFYPHQFKPVLKFIESPIGRLLIADEVGLGKTIESLYIWKELQARHDARRLLVVCPAMLREKWRDDFRLRFNISADIVDANDLLEVLSDVSQRGGSRSFTYIISLEAMRPPRDFDDFARSGKRAALARLLDQNIASDEFALFDLVILDEAHYLRNPTTASNRLGRLLRDAAHHMVLLTATPIQIASDNLYQLIRLLEPDEFYDSRLFDDVLSANAPVVSALRRLWRQPPDLHGAAEAIKEAMSNVYFENDTVLRRIVGQMTDDSSNAEKQIELARMLESRSLLGQYMVRSRKREVLETRVERAPQVLMVEFNELERQVYNRISEHIRSLSVGRTGVFIFALIARQRQMASSLVAALESWRNQGLLEELLWEDLGRTVNLVQDEIEGEQGSEKTLEEVLHDLDWKQLGNDPTDGTIFKVLEAEDTKYDMLKQFLREALRQNCTEKFVIFAYFRGTLQYLARRLSDDGINTALIMGGMGDAKYKVLKSFSNPDGPNVLLSSEVGSEGIDLQFCRIIVNYDLPWNPMRVEQRIGRLDRLGQKAERISIVNLAVSDTIEDRILLRLYERIHLFRDSIGDLEDILGEMTEQLMKDLLNPSLSSEEREQRASEAELAILNQRAEQDRLEQEAVNLIGFSDYILDHVRDSRDKGRWLSPEELIALVDDFFSRKYPGTRIERDSKYDFAARLRLSDAARSSLGHFIVDTKPATRTKLHRLARPILCLFDPRQVETFGRDVELIDPTHPLIQWIRADYARDSNQLYPVSAIRIDRTSVQVPPNDYAFVAHRWSFVGLREDHVLAFRAVPLNSLEPLSGVESERIIVAAARHGRHFPNAVNVIGDIERIKSSAQICEETLEDAFAERMIDFEAENELRCGQQETSARKFTERRISELKNRLDRYRTEGKLRPIPMTEGLLKSEQAQLGDKLERINRRKMVDPTLVPLATGIVRVE